MRTGRPTHTRRETEAPTVVKHATRMQHGAVGAILCDKDANSGAMRPSVPATIVHNDANSAGHMAFLSRPCRIPRRHKAAIARAWPLGALDSMKLTSPSPQPTCRTWVKGVDMVGRLPEPLWNAIEAALPFPECTSIDDRRVIEAVVFILRSGASWRTLTPAVGMPCAMTVSRRLRLWHKARIWPTIEELLRRQLPDGPSLPWERHRYSRISAARSTPHGWSLGDRASTWRSALWIMKVPFQTSLPRPTRRSDYRHAGACSSASVDAMFRGDRRDHCRWATRRVRRMRRRTSSARRPTGTMLQLPRSASIISAPPLSVRLWRSPP